MGEMQTTLGRAVEFSGAGLHGGVEVSMRISPAEADTGYVFVRNGVRIPAIAANAGKVRRCTSLEAGGECVHTVEHVLSALFGLGVDNAVVELSAPEPPAMDGSSLPLCMKLLEAGIIDLGTPAKYLTVERPVFADGRDGSAMALPHDGFSVAVYISYPGHAVLPEQTFECEVTPESYVAEIAPARTYGFIEEAEALRAAGLALGASEDNTLVVYPDRYSSALRLPGEPARHKALDMAGDLSLLGTRVRGRFVCHRAGHELNGELVAKLLAGEGAAK